MHSSHRMVLKSPETRYREKGVRHQDLQEDLSENQVNFQEDQKERQAIQAEMDLEIERRQR